jgi:6-phosphogluconolactonase
VAQFADSALVVVSDLGLDRIFSYRVGEDGSLLKVGELAARPGAGPRHIALHPDGQSFFVFNELDSTIGLLRRSADDSLVSLDVVAALPAGSGESHGADIHVSPDGRFIYGSNRGHDSIAIFRIEQGSGKLEPLGHAPSGGNTPRNFAITPSGRHLVVANQDSDTIAILERDAESGMLRDTGRRLEIGTPMCVRVIAL